MIIKKICSICNKEYEADTIRLKFGRQTTCSRECSYKKRGRILGDSHIGKSSWNKGEMHKVKCIQCDITFQIYPYELRNERKFCSKECRIKYSDKGKTKEAFRLRTSKRYAIWRTVIFERDNYTCQVCGHIGSKLNADHIKPFSIFPKLRFVADNGRTLCEECHKQTSTFGNRYKSIYKNLLFVEDNH